MPGSRGPLKRVRQTSLGHGWPIPRVHSNMTI